MAKKDAEPFGGHDHEFVGEVPDRFNCQICAKVIREPHLAVCCGQHFCESCLNKWFTRQGKETELSSLPSRGRRIPSCDQQRAEE